MVAHIGGARPQVTCAQVHEALVRRRGLPADGFSVHLHRPEDFLVVFASAEGRNRLVERPVLEHGGFSLHFRQWNRQAQASLEVWKTKVHLVIEGVPPHAWEREVVDGLLGTSCSIDTVAPETVSRADLATFKVTAWAPDPEIIPPARTLAVPEPIELGDDVARPTTERKLLTYKVLVHIDAIEEVLVQGERRLDQVGPASVGSSGGEASGGGGAGRVLRRRQWHFGVQDRRGVAADRDASSAGQHRSYCQVAASSPSWRLPSMDRTVAHGRRGWAQEERRGGLNSEATRETATPAANPLGRCERTDK
ncbi:hypothetical protein ACQ4PT_040592 [Festuca glaucescens]